VVSLAHIPSTPLGSRLCIPSEFRRIPAEVGQKSPAGMEWSRIKHRNVLLLS